MGTKGWRRLHLILFLPLLTFLRIQDLPERAQGLVQKFILILTFIIFIWSLSDTFYVLFVIDAVGYKKLGFLLAVSFILQSCLDYPSGALGDWIGQKWVLFIAFMGFGLSFGLLAISHSFESLLVVYTIQAIAASQESGALDTWFDNNYKVAASEVDPERETYKFLTGRWQTIFSFIGAIAFLCGGLMATLFFRELIFVLQAIMLIIISFVLLIVVNDFPEVDRPKRSVRNYFKLLGQGLKVVFFNRTLFLLILGMSIFGIIWTIWGAMILFPLYFGYTGSDAGASAFRFGIWMLGLIPIFYSANLAAKLDTNWIPWLHLLHTYVFFVFFITLTVVFPFTDEFELIPILLTTIFFSFSGIFIYTTNILEQRILLDLIPDENRNSIYSLIPTLIRIGSAPTIFIAGIMITEIGLPSTLIFLFILSSLGVILYFFALIILPMNALKS